MILVGIKLKNFGIFKDFKIGQTKEDEHNESFSNVNIFIGEHATGKKTLREAFNCMMQSRFGAIYVYDKHLKDYYTEGMPIEIEFFLRGQDLYSYCIEFGKDEKDRSVFLKENLINLSKNKTLLSLKSKHEEWLSEGFVLDEEGEKIELEIETSVNSGLDCLYDKKISGEVLAVKYFFDRMMSLNLSAEEIKSRHILVNVMSVGTEGERLEDFLSLALKSDEENTNKMIRSVGECFGIKGLKAYKKRKFVFLSGENMTERHVTQMSDGFLYYLAYVSTLRGLRTFPADYNGKMSSLFINTPEKNLDVKKIEALSGEIWNGLRTHKVRQFFAVTYSPFFLNSFEPTSVWNLKKDSNGDIRACKVSQYPYVNELYQEGIPLGDLWYSDYFPSS